MISATIKGNGSAETSLKLRHLGLVAVGVYLIADFSSRLSSQPAAFSACRRWAMKARDSGAGYRNVPDELYVMRDFVCVSRRRVRRSLLASRNNT
ncbi:hypothetical protein GWI33_018192 [Rhynchophorus ferrugineus]|uniref:Uncharacterized protein n=1 Tax=Rhynchophorus ferrugineus TaxID=354439 RepID=A0A834HTW9_RHYFE|nr:hypothetical protein GWI33_018192 [Rhynchophorus ferrugineus]